MRPTYVHTSAKKEIARLLGCFFITNLTNSVLYYVGTVTVQFKSYFPVRCYVKCSVLSYINTFAVAECTLYQSLFCDNPLLYNGGVK